MGDRKLRYIVNAPSFDPDSGGTIFLHELAHTLNSLGEEAYVWPMAPIFRQGVKSRLWSLISRPAFDTSPSLNTPLAHKRMFNAPDTVVVYPEIVPGNPMGAQNVVRWLLYKPGDQHPYSFTEGEMCYIVRKGHRKPRLPETEAEDAIDIHGMSHAEINEVFNRCERFYSYDEATMYSQFAVLSGCLSIVVPGEYPDRATWNKQHDLSINGIAYGDTSDEIAHALATRDKLLEQLETKEQAGLETVKNFVALTYERFSLV